MPIFFNKITPVERIQRTAKQTNSFAAIIEEQRRKQQKAQQVAQKPTVEKKSVVRETVEKPVRNNKTSAYMQDLMNK